MPGGDTPVTGQPSGIATVPRGTSVIQLVQKPPEKGWLDGAIYAPAIPGVIVALLGLWIAHRLTIRRERRKESADLCDLVAELAEAAVEAALAGWAADVGPERVQATYKAKWQAQKVGAAATRLHGQSSGLMSSGINVVKEAAAFRTALFDDPIVDFLDTKRAPDSTRAPALNGALSSFIGHLDYLRNIVLR